MLAALGACTSMTVRMYASRKKLKLAPRAIENNTRVLAGERGRFRLAIIPGTDVADVSTLLIAPVDHNALFFQTLRALTAVIRQLRHRRP